MAYNPILESIFERIRSIPNLESIIEWTFFIFTIVTIASIVVSIILFCVVQFVYSSTERSQSKKKDIHNKDHFVLFIDLSVIVDCDHASTQSVISALSKFGITQIDESSFKPFLGTGEGEIISQLCVSKNINLPEIRQKSSAFYQESLKNGKIRPVDGSTNLLTQFTADNRTVILISSFDQRKIKQTLAYSHISPNSFDMIVAGDSLPHKKPLPDIYTITINKMNVLPSQCLAIEHTPNGILAAKSAGMHCMAVQSSSFSLNELKKGNPDKVLMRVSDVFSCIDLFEKEILKNWIADNKPDESDDVVIDRKKKKKK